MADAGITVTATPAELPRPFGFGMAMKDRPSQHWLSVSFGPMASPGAQLYSGLVEF
jgi:hypothetical protein